MNAAKIHAELLRLLARRGELTAELEQTDLAIARHRGMFEAAVAIQAAAAAERPADPAAAPAGDRAP